jgi:phytoene/squalene synthetase
MTITLPDELAERLQERAREQGISLETLLAELLDEEWEESELEDREDEAELAEIRNAIEESLDEFNRGESHPAEVVFAELRRRHGLPD